MSCSDFYLFLSLPIPVPAAFFSSLDKLTRRYIWHGKNPRVGLDKLTIDYSQGGLDLPNFRMYYWAAQSRFLAQRFDNGPSPSWLNIETLEVNDDTGAELFYKWDRKSIKTITDNPLIIHSVLAWCKRQGSLVSWTSNRKVASSNPRADKVQICRSAPEQAVNPLFLGRH